MFYRLFLLVIFLTVCFKAEAINPINYDSNLSSYIGNKVLFFEDASNNLTIEDFLKNNKKFELNKSDVPNFGVTKSTYWLKFELINNSDCDNLVINVENPLLNYVDIYVVNSDTLVESIHNDYSDGYKNRVFDHQYYTFKLFIEPQDTMTYYIKTQSDMSLLVPISIHNKENATDKMLYFDLRTGIFVGIMLAMLLYNLFLYVSSRDRQYLYYVNYIFWVASAQLALVGLFHRFLADNYPIANYIVPFAGAMSAIASVLFVRSFLSINEYSKRFNIYLNLIIVVDIIAILLLFVDISLAYNIVNIVAGIGALFLFYIAIYVKFKGNKAANFFIIAWSVFLLSVVVFVLKDVGLIKYSQFTTYVVQLGVSIEAMLLSFALGNKINTYRKEKEESQKREFIALRENERLIREQNEILELKIEERTQELQYANESLQVTLDDLKEAQSQLVESEKMASLGQLTAGVAHEINNPINFVTSNVKPLKRDLDMVWEAFSYIESIAFDTDLDYDQKKDKVDTYKEELDIDYLKTEIDFLLKGMHDGASRTAEIVKSLRVFSRVDEDTVLPADVNLGIESTLVIIGSLLSENIELEKNLNYLPQIECYPGKLNQVFLNIFTNAIYAIEKKFKGKIGGKLKIESLHLPEENQIQILVEDNGIGIPEDILNKIFEPFFTTKDVGEGTGLGMSIAYNTISKHNGELKVKSVVGEKTIFTINLPVNQSR